MTIMIARTSTTTEADPQFTVVACMSLLGLGLTLTLAAMNLLGPDFAAALALAG